VGKLQWSALAQDLTEFMVDLMGDEAVLYPPGYALHRTEAKQMDEMDPRSAYLWARSLTIGGGTSEVMRNVIGERVLGLPEEPRVDKTLPWRETLRG
jgi:alkylation response protein AidB-like acyl-CoA dehydrogenase